MKKGSESDADFFKQYFYDGALERQLKRIITSGARGDGLLNVSPEDFFKLKILKPSLTEQQKIATVLQAADRELETLERKLAALQAQKKGLMQQLLTGKVRVKAKETAL